MSRVHGNERGIALAVAMFALVVVGALVAGAFYVGTQEQRGGDNQYRLSQSLGIAEAGAPELIRQWDNDSFNVLRVFPADTYKLGTRATAGNTGAFGGSVWKLNRNLYLIDVDGRDNETRSGGAAFRRRGGGARQRVGVLARIRPLQIPAGASLTTQGNITMGGNAAVNGADQTPNATWSTCAPPDTTQAGITTTPGGTVTGSGNNWSVTGDPPLENDAAIDSTTFTQFGDVSWAMLASQANITLPAGTYTTEPVVDGAGRCNKAVLTNWGDGVNRAAPCGSYFPIVHVVGDLKLNNTQGQGVLLVDGNLEVQGSYQWFGVVIVRGSLKTAGGGATAAHFWGAVIARNVDLDVNSLSGKATLNYSKCAIMQALEWTGLGAMMRSRSFVVLN
jgi:hypothetical protein